jgi:hypothetical protein
MDLTPLNFVRAGLLVYLWLMPATKNLIVVLPLFLLVLASCSIEKRQHRSGYYIAWKKHGNTTKQDPATFGKGKTKVRPESLPLTASVNDRGIIPLAKEQGSAADSSGTSVPGKKPKSSPHISGIKYGHLLKKQSPVLHRSGDGTSRQTVPTNVAAVAGFISALLSILCVVLLYTSSFGAFSFFFILLLAILSLTGFILGIIGLKRAKSGKFSGKAYAVAALAITSLLLFLLLVLGIAVLWLFI